MKRPTTFRAENMYPQKRTGYMTPSPQKPTASAGYAKKNRKTPKYLIVGDMTLYSLIEW